MALIDMRTQVAAGSLYFEDINAVKNALQLGSSSIITSGLEVLNGAQFNMGAYFDAVNALGINVSGVDWTLSNKASVIPTGTNTFVFTAPTGPTNTTLQINWGGSATQSWPVTVKWPSGTEPMWTASSGAVDLVNFYYNGTNYYGGALLDLR